MKIKIVKKDQMVVNKIEYDYCINLCNSQQRKIANKDEIIEQANARLDELNTRIKKLEQRIDILKANYDETLKTNIDLEAEIAALTLQKYKLAKSNAGYKGNITKMQKELKVLKGGKDGKCK